MAGILWLLSSEKAVEKLQLLVVLPSMKLLAPFIRKLSVLAYSTILHGLYLECNEATVRSINLHCTNTLNP